MKTKIVNLKKNSNETSKAGKPYIAHVIEHQKPDGKTSKKLILTNSPLFGKFMEFDNGDFIDVKTVKNGQYWDWVDVKKITQDEYTQAPQYQNKQGGGGFKQKFDDKGMRIGNITNAATAIFAAKLTKTLEEAVDKVFAAQAYIESVLDKPKEQAQPKAEAPKIEADELDISDDEAF